MAQRFTLFVCDDATKAAQAKGDLEADGYRVILVEQVAFGTCDGETYDSGGNHPFVDKWVVIGTR